MSNQLSIADELFKLEKSFNQQNNFGLVFKTECLFARQQITKNDFVFSTAQNNPGSLRNAILNVAAIGISLNPASAHAYLVPRDGMICLDISYRGLVKLATDSGAIEWAKPELVYEGDEFKYKGPSIQPNHVTDPFDSSHTFETLKGAYCIAKLVSGDYMIEVMSKSEIDKIKDTSKAKSGPWQTWPEEMAKKSVVKRASKSWPQSNGRDRIDRAVEILNEHEGLVDESPKHVADYLHHSPEQEKEFHELLQADPVDFYLWWSELDDRIKTSLVNSFTEQKGKGRELQKRMEDTGRNKFIDMKTALEEACIAEDDMGAKEILEGLPENQYKALIDALPGIELVRFAMSLGVAA